MSRYLCRLDGLVLLMLSFAAPATAYTRALV
jgi:hypothetical protein